MPYFAKGPSNVNENLYCFALTFQTIRNMFNLSENLLGAIVIRPKAELFFNDKAFSHSSMALCNRGRMYRRQLGLRNDAVSSAKSASSTPVFGRGISFTYADYSTRESVEP
ncbi:hypothetical protein EVAR_99548_1 [Eumeta japonica]|uniref:Uncharacterized protein n=1 Tax=Eumeta variegata TaxID=151549 RepID=A0A4C1YYA7_EUMVA|nr:hypothetical protein EVAR_99548_1 [Eumeta japonica]